MEELVVIPGSMHSIDFMEPVFALRATPGKPEINKN